MRFKTYLNQRGYDYRDIIGLSERYGNIEPKSAVLDYSNERTVVYVGGGGEGRYRQIAAVARDAQTTVEGRSFWGFHGQFYIGNELGGHQLLANTGFGRLRVITRRLTLGRAS
jgi:hypothetical protein